VFAEVVSDRGRGATIVYVPGIDGSGQLLLGTAARLEERYRLLRLRYRLSANPSHRTYAHLAASTIEAVSLRGVDRMVLLAESFGGAVALRAAIDFPERVTALALVNTFAHYRRRRRLAMSRIGLRLTPDWLVRAGRSMLAPRLLFGGRDDRAAIEDFVGRQRPSRTDASGAAPVPTVVWGLDEGYHCRLRMIQGLDLRRDLGRILQPVTLFASGRDRIVDSARQAREMAGALPDAQVVDLDGRGHVVLPLADIDWPAHLERLIARAVPRPRIESS
jgi:pimeloyl-ACP methyl ester carboxylesterase